MPSCALVPFPNSSTRQSERRVEWRIMLLICVRSAYSKVRRWRHPARPRIHLCALALTMKAEAFASVDSRDTILVKIASVRPTVADSAGTNDPMCARKQVIPTMRR